jgi:type IV pilus modification protein PilV
VQSSRGQSGFTVIEILVALAIFTVAILGVAVSATTVIQANQRSFHNTLATNLAQDKIEELRANPATVTNGSDSVTPDNLNLVFSRSWTVTANTPVSGRSTVTVTVTWNAYGTRSISISTVI